MSDVRIIRRRTRAHIEGTSRLGSVWIMENLDGAVEIKAQIQIDVVNDLIKDMEEAGLNVEIR